MSENIFSRFAPFIQEFIYNNDWTELRQIQGEAAEAIFDSQDHLLICSGTASGKTEAAFLPVLSELYFKPSATIGAVYIGPLKALINDQFGRLSEMLTESTIPVQSWHGDVDSGKKQKFLRKAKGILQITPESLEAMLMTNGLDLGRLFSDLRFVIIDELHAFISSDRGSQILCQLDRLSRYQSSPVRRIGLSATLGKSKLAAQWLAGNSGIEVKTIGNTPASRDVQLGLEFYPELPLDFETVLSQAEKALDQRRIEELAALLTRHNAMFEDMYELSRGKKTLIFTNSRRDAEEVTAHLREIAQIRKTRDIYHVHHGNVSKVLREAAEQAMKDPIQPACSTATVTLELGIDIGYLDQVFQRNATHSVASFVQRLGRTGRRNNPAQMFFYSTESLTADDASVVQKIPWGLIQTIAIIQLYLEYRWIEPPTIKKYPFSLLYHQTMSVIFANNELLPPELAERILTLSPFRSVTQDQFRTLLRHLIAIKHLELTETGGLIIGVEGEKIVNNYKFYATFEDEIAYQVKDGTRDIGSIHALPAIADRFRLAGFTWKVVGIDEKHKIISVERVAGRSNTNWLGKGGDIHDRILDRMREVLEEDVIYPYLHPKATERLQQARQLARDFQLTEQQLIPLSDSSVIFLPWCGTRTFETLLFLFEHLEIQRGIQSIPYYVELTIPRDESFASMVKPLRKNDLNLASLVETLNADQLRRDKYDRFVPDSLLREAYITDRLDIESAMYVLDDIDQNNSASNA
jgi:ATP-dependent Lhr-like helicase